MKVQLFFHTDIADKVNALSRQEQLALYQGAKKEGRIRPHFDLKTKLIDGLIVDVKE